MTPFFFGKSTHQLFGAYDPAQGRSSKGLVICYPWAREYLLAHPTLRRLAQRMAARGWHVLRFDYFGTGDSAGDLSEATPQQWLADVETAIDELKDMAELESVTLFGMRYGAALAARTAVRRKDVDRLVLWDPVLDGRAYFAELGVPARVSGAAKEIEGQGVVLADHVRAEMEQITTQGYGAGLPPTLIISTGADKDGSIQQRLAAAGVQVTVEHVPDIQVWREEWGRGGVGLGVAAASQVESWLG